jgi:hypothetical protein
MSNQRSIANHPQNASKIIRHRRTDTQCGTQSPTLGAKSGRLIERGRERRRRGGCCSPPHDAAEAPVLIPLFFGKPHPPIPSPVTHTPATHREGGSQPPPLALHEEGRSRRAGEEERGASTSTAAQLSLALASFLSFAVARGAARSSGAAAAPTSSSTHRNHGVHLHQGHRAQRPGLHVAPGACRLCRREFGCLCMHASCLARLLLTPPWGAGPSSSKSIHPKASRHGEKRPRAMV